MLCLLVSLLAGGTVRFGSSRFGRHLGYHSILFAVRHAVVRLRVRLGTRLAPGNIPEQTGRPKVEGAPALLGG